MRVSVFPALGDAVGDRKRREAVALMELYAEGFMLADGDEEDGGRGGERGAGAECSCRAHMAGGR